MFFCWVNLVRGQEEPQQTVTGQIEQAYNNFDFETVDRLLAVAMQSIGNLPANQQTMVLKYAAFRAFQQNQTAIAEDHFRRLLLQNPGYSLDPVSTSPKLLSLFQQVKIAYYEELEQRFNELESGIFPVARPWRSLVFPGWEQWHRGHRVKGALWAGVGVLTLAGTAQSIVRSRGLRDDYLNETDPQQIPQRFQEYRDVYQSQFYWSYALLACWLSAHVDALFFTNDRNPVSIGVVFPAPSPQLSLKLRF